MQQLNNVSAEVVAGRDGACLALPCLLLLILNWTAVAGPTDYGRHRWHMTCPFPPFHVWCQIADGGVTAWGAYCTVSHYCTLRAVARRASRTFQKKLSSLLCLALALFVAHKLTANQVFSFDAISNNNQARDKRNIDQWG